jgi:hypothetical protein
VGLSVEAPNEEYIEHQTVTMDVGHDRLSDTEEELAVVGSESLRHAGKTTSSLIHLMLDGIN